MSPRASESSSLLDWAELARLTQGEKVTVERVKLPNGVALEGSFELPPLARLTMDDQVFVIAFVQTQGSIKDMEKLFGLSYPSIKNRLRDINGKLGFVETKVAPSRREILERLEQGEITAAEAKTLLEQS